MALIECPECGGKVSDKAPACIHCGYPLNSAQEQNRVDANSPDINEYDLILHSYGNSQLEVIKAIREVTNLGLKDAKELTEDLPKVVVRKVAKEQANALAKKIRSFGGESMLAPSRLTSAASKSPANNKEGKRPVVRCPKCGSESISTGQRGYSLMWGFIGAGNTVNRCANCGYKWKQKG